MLSKANQDNSIHDNKIMEFQTNGTQDDANVKQGKSGQFNS